MIKEAYRPLTEINVTNLVDVTLVLLIIFMITAPILKNEIEVSLPETENIEATTREGFVITLQADGQLFIDGKRIERKNLESELLAKYNANNQPVIMLKADKQVDYGQVIQIMDVVKKIGINNMGLVVDVQREE
jgi:biopolymer transport protein TolR